MGLAAREVFTKRRSPIGAGQVDFSIPTRADTCICRKYPCCCNDERAGLREHELTAQIRWSGSQSHAPSNAQALFESASERTLPAAQVNHVLARFGQL
jgi:hypothetical protein